MSQSKKLIIVDVSNFIFRAFYAIRSLTAPDGTPTNAVHGVWSMLYKLISVHRPTHLFLARDTSGGCFRNEMYGLYKANRSEPPEDLIPQFALIQELIEKMGLNNLALKNYEADDIIGSACVQWRDYFDEILVASGDKDLMQFVGGKVKILDTMKDKIFDRAGVFEKMGVWPEQIVDYLALLGDSSDNIPGMRGIGAKGAAKLLAEYETLESCFGNSDKMQGKRLINAFANHKEDALLSKKLVQIITDLDLQRTAEDTFFTFRPGDALKDFFKRYGLKSALKKISDEEFRESMAVHNISENDGNVTAEVGDNNFKILHDSGGQLRFTKKTIDDIQALLPLIKASTVVACFIQYDSENIVTKKILKMGLTLDGNEALFIGREEHFDWVLTELWSDEKRMIISQGMQADFSYLAAKNIVAKAVGIDLLQAHFNINPSGQHELKALALTELDIRLIEIGKGEELGDLTEDLVLEYCCERAIAIWALWDKFKEELKILKVDSVFFDIDNPLLKVLAKMESAGVMLNGNFLKKLECAEEETILQIDGEIRAEIRAFAAVEGLPCSNKASNPHDSDEPINLRSPKQVASLLFDLLKLPIIKKTKTGASTDSEVLTELDGRGLSKIPGLILQLREHEKILSTYIKVLPELINPITKRIHTSFNQREARTGRLSSLNPNLQNIPIRSESGRKIRKAFIPRPGYLFLAADYSQVELRLLAHFSGDETMLSAFKNNVDIHIQTAAEVFKIPRQDVSPDQRSIAKAVNFGLMYGQSSFGLSKTLRIGRKEAKEYITNYFNRFSRVKSYLDSLKEFAEAHGYSKTFFGRKRFLPEIKSSNRNIKARAERVAINGPIQGTAADIIKVAMLNLDRALTEKKLAATLLLQVHDELILEVPEGEIGIVQELVRDKMENVVELTIPLKVEMGMGVNWYDLK